ncbi:AP-3 complex subunit delta-1-like [Macrobrachium nipponense]|uniref:AP-3 complex subunit delta-1-like n=1 Tax=Macrobrachium nipponense TaxID=159736 RepID=UPI0030C7E6CA
MRSRLSVWHQPKREASQKAQTFVKRRDYHSLSPFPIRTLSPPEERRPDFSTESPLDPELEENSEDENRGREGLSSYKVLTALLLEEYEDALTPAAAPPPPRSLFSSAKAKKSSSFLRMKPTISMKRALQSLNSWMDSKKESRQDEVLSARPPPVRLTGKRGIWYQTGENMGLSLPSSAEADFSTLVDASRRQGLNSARVTWGISELDHLLKGLFHVLEVFNFLDWSLGVMSKKAHDSEGLDPEVLLCILSCIDKAVQDGSLEILLFIWSGLLKKRTVFSAFLTKAVSHSQRAALLYSPLSDFLFPSQLVKDISRSLTEKATQDLLTQSSRKKRPATAVEKKRDRVRWFSPFEEALPPEHPQEGRLLRREVTNLLVDRLPVFVSSGDLEVQERASCILQIVNYVQKCHKNGEKIGADLALLLSGELNPVAPRAQKKVPIPDGLDLDAWINDPPSESEADDDEEDGEKADIFVKSESSSRERKKEKYEPTEDELQKLRDARRAEQASNPYYVKSLSQSSPRPNHNNIQVDEIPVAALDLNVSLKIPGMTSLDKYQVVDGWEGSKKRHTKKQKKRSKRRGRVSSSSEEEMPQTHIVNTDVGEMPEGANISDDNEPDDRPEDDPHRALDIDLDEPLAPNEVLPTRTHYEVRAKPPEENTANLISESPSKKKSSKKAKREKHKKHEKTKKKKEVQAEEKPQESLILDLIDPIQGVSVSEEAPTTANHVNGVLETESENKVAVSDPSDDLAFWLSSDTPAAATKVEEEDSCLEKSSKENAPSTAPEISDKPESKTKKKSKEKDKKPKKDKDKEKEKKKHDKKSKKKGKGDTEEKDSSSRNRADYEETNGICEEVEEEPVIAQPPPYRRLLAEDSAIKLVYSTAAMDGLMSHVVVSITFSSHCAKDITKLELSIPDTSALKIIRSDPDSDILNLPWTLAPGQSQDSQLSFTTEDDTIPHKLRGTLHYTRDGGTTSELSIRLEFPVTCFLSGKTASWSTFTDLLGSGQLCARSSFTIPECQLTFPEVLETISCDGSLAVVESVDQTASLYGRSLRGHHVCLLVKYQVSSRLTIDGKSTEGTLLSNALDHLRTVLSQDKPSS